jgi:hypothetical protein
VWEEGIIISSGYVRVSGWTNTLPRQSQAIPASVCMLCCALRVCMYVCERVCVCGCVCECLCRTKWSLHRIGPSDGPSESARGYSFLRKSIPTRDIQDL